MGKEITKLFTQEITNASYYVDLRMELFMSVLLLSFMMVLLVTKMEHQFVFVGNAWCEKYHLLYVI